MGKKDDDDLRALEQRIKHYGLSLDPKKLEDKVLSKDDKLELSASPEKGCKDGPTHILETDDIDQVKRWIGVPDAIAEQRCCHRTATAPRGWLVQSKDERALARAVRRIEPDVVHRLAREYVFGDARRVVQYKPILEQFYGRFRIPLWIFRRIVVGPGAVLQFNTSNPVVLQAGTIEIASTGRIVSRSSLNVDCITLQQMA
jgi:hypothetical protein